MSQLSAFAGLTSFDAPHPRADHGKTTLVDKLLQACNTEGEGKDGGVDRLLDK